MFQLDKYTEVVCTNANVRVELHGKNDKARAIDLRWRLSGENTLLDLIEAGLREHYYFNKALTAGQEVLPGVLIPMPNLRHPMLPHENIKYGDKAYRGYRFTWSYGIEEEHVDFTDVVVSNMVIEKMEEGGSVSILFSTQYNGEELDTDALYGELAGLPAMDGTQMIRLLAPAELMAVKKGYRANKPDAPSPPPPNPNQGELRGDGGATGDADEDEDDALAEATGFVGTVEDSPLTPLGAMLAGEVQGEQPQEFDQPQEEQQSTPRVRRSRGPRKAGE